MADERIEIKPVTNGPASTFKDTINDNFKMTKVIIIDGNQPADNILRTGDFWFKVIDTN